MGCFFTSCVDPETEKAQKKLEEGKCREEALDEIVENYDLLTLGISKGFEKETKAFQKTYKDSTINCESLKKSWQEYKDLVLGLE